MTADTADGEVADVLDTAAVYSMDMIAKEAIVEVADTLKTVKRPTLNNQN